jgi:LacI family transcriptional regulator
LGFELGRLTCRNPIRMETTYYEHLESFQSLGNPIVFFDRPCHLDNCVNITIDNYAASFKATEHLILRGCKLIAHFSGKQNIDLYKQRKEGYLGALQKHQIPIDENLIFESNLSEEDGVIMAKKMLKNPEIDGLYSSNDTAAISAIQYLKT